MHRAGGGRGGGGGGSGYYHQYPPQPSATQQQQQQHYNYYPTAGAGAGRGGAVMPHYQPPYPHHHHHQQHQPLRQHDWGAAAAHHAPASAGGHPRIPAPASSSTASSSSSSSSQLSAPLDDFGESTEVSHILHAPRPGTSTAATATMTPATASAPLVVPAAHSRPPGLSPATTAAAQRQYAYQHQHPHHHQHRRQHQQQHTVSFSVTTAGDASGAGGGDIDSDSLSGARYQPLQHGGPHASTARRPRQPASTAAPAASTGPGSPPRARRRQGGSSEVKPSPITYSKRPALRHDPLTDGVRPPPGGGGGGAGDASSRTPARTDVTDTIARGARLFADSGAASGYSPRKGTHQNGHAEAMSTPAPHRHMASHGPPPAGEAGSAAAARWTPHATPHVGTRMAASILSTTLRQPQGRPPVTPFTPGAATLFQTPAPRTAQRQLKLQQSQAQHSRHQAHSGGGNADTNTSARRGGGGGAQPVSRAMMPTPGSRTPRSAGAALHHTPIRSTASKSRITAQRSLQGALDLPTGRLDLGDPGQPQPDDGGDGGTFSASFEQGRRPAAPWIVTPHQQPQQQQRSHRRHPQHQEEQVQVAAASAARRRSGKTPGPHSAEGAADERAPPELTASTAAAAGGGDAGASSGDEGQPFQFYASFMPFMPHHQQNVAGEPMGMASVPEGGSSGGLGAAAAAFGGDMLRSVPANLASSGRSAASDTSSITDFSESGRERRVWHNGNRSTAQRTDGTSVVTTGATADELRGVWLMHQSGGATSSGDDGDDSGHSAPTDASAAAAVAATTTTTYATSRHEFAANAAAVATPAASSSRDSENGLERMTSPHMSDMLRYLAGLTTTPSPQHGSATAVEVDMQSAGPAAGRSTEYDVMDRLLSSGPADVLDDDEEEEEEEEEEERDAAASALLAGATLKPHAPEYAPSVYAQAAAAATAMTASSSYNAAAGDPYLSDGGHSSESWAGVAAGAGAVPAELRTTQRGPSRRPVSAASEAWKLSHSPMRPAARAPAQALGTHPGQSSRQQPPLPASAVSNSGPGGRSTLSASAAVYSPAVKPPSMSRVAPTGAGAARGIGHSHIRVPPSAGDRRAAPPPATPPRPAARHQQQQQQHRSDRNAAAAAPSSHNQSMPVASRGATTAAPAPPLPPAPPVPATPPTQRGHGKVSVQQDAARKRVALVESPPTRMAFKEFYKQFRAKERASSEEAHNFAMDAFTRLPLKVHWRLFLELADLARRENRTADARDLYKAATMMRPDEPQVWLDYAKAENETGNPAGCRAILQQGLQHCKNNEALLTKAIKHEERQGNLKGARNLLSRLQAEGVSLERSWRTILEGALLEARAGNVRVARRVFKFLMENVPWYGPIYYEAFRFEERTQHMERALRIVRRGIREISQYGPLWFGAFRLYEKLETRAFTLRCAAARRAGNPVLPPPPPPVSPSSSASSHSSSTASDSSGAIMLNWLPITRRTLLEATSRISKELVWKVLFEAAQIEERAADVVLSVVKLPIRSGLDVAVPAVAPGDAAHARQCADAFLTRARAFYVQSIVHCPANLRWKVWLAGARMELCSGNNEAAALRLLQRALSEVPAKSRSQVLLDVSRLHEYCGNTPAAEEVLQYARSSLGNQWKVFLESILLKSRAGKRSEAIEQAEEALKLHRGTGRLWAVLVQLRQPDGQRAQLEVLERALREVPKSGEVWCEAARVALAVNSCFFDLELARTYLEFAIQFTPQYGDSFVELMRLELLTEALRVLDKDPTDLFERTAPSAVGTPRESAVDGLCGSMSPMLFASGEEEEIPLAEFLAGVDTTDVERRCVNAGPNYGGVWFYCKDRPYDTALEVIKRAKVTLCLDIGAMLASTVEGGRGAGEYEPRTTNVLALASGGASLLGFPWSAPNRSPTSAGAGAGVGAGVDAGVGASAGAGAGAGASSSGAAATGTSAALHVGSLPASVRRRLLFGSDQIVP